MREEKIFIRGNEIIDRLTKIVFEYEAKIDGEWGCCHSAEEIAAGLCDENRPADIPAIAPLQELWRRLEMYQRRCAALESLLAHYRVGATPPSKLLDELGYTRVFINAKGEWDDGGLDSQVRSGDSALG